MQHAWRPRLSLFLGYGSGDRDPFDQQNNRFERFFGFARPWSANDYITWENLKAPKLRLEFQPSSTIRIDMGYSRYWLASAQDRFNNLLEGSAFNRDASGTSGDYLGDEFDARVRIELGEHLDANIGYTHFRNGDFVQARQSAASGASASDSDFLYLELSLSLF